MKYSIITINYNNHNGLHHTIESVISQSFKDYEFIIIDGGSTDGSVDVIKEHQQHITYWVSEKDNGIYHAMNKGVKAALGEYLCFMNSGDMFYDDQVLEHSLPYLYSDIVHGVAKNVNSPVSTLCLVKIPGMSDLFSPTLHHQACIFKRALFENELYDEHYKIVSDWKFYIDQMIFHTRSFSCMPVIVALCEGGGLSEKELNLGINERIDVLEEMVRLAKKNHIYNERKEMLMHLMFTSKQRLIIDKNVRNIKQYINIFPESNKYYKYYPFTKKQKVLFFLAEYRMTYLLKIMTSIL